MERYPQELLDKTIRLWQPYSNLDLSSQDALEIIDNTIALFELLEELEDKYGKEQTDLQHKLD